MKLTPFLFPLVALLLVPTAFAKSTSRELEAEYEQVRKIALKDPKVRAAFDRANEKLNEKIVEIDPALKPIIAKQGAAKTKAATASQAAQPRPAASPTDKTYIVVKGDTLTSIAARFGVTAADLKSANGIADEHKLQIGQQLRIPKARAGTQTATKSDESLWSRVKSSF
jgi:LysM repeat protein